MSHSNFLYSPIEAVFDKEFTLEQLLDRDELKNGAQINYFDVINMSEYNDEEVKSGRLIDFLVQPRNIGRLLDYLIISPSEDASYAVKYRYPTFACSFFTFGYQLVEMAILEHQEFFDRLYSYWNQPTHYKHLTAGVHRVVVHFLKNSTLCYKAAEKFRENPHFFDSVLQYDEDLGMAGELLSIFLSNFEEGYYLQMLNFFVDRNLMGILIDKFVPEKWSIHTNVSYTIIMLIEHVGVESSPLFDSFASAENQTKLYKHILTPNNLTALEHGLQAICYILCMIASIEHTFDRDVTSSESISTLIQQILDHLADMKQLLLTIDAGELVLGSGKSVKAFGLPRLTVVDLVSGLLTLEYNVVDNALIELDFFALFLSWMFEYKHNSVLLKSIETALVFVMRGCNEALIMCLLNEPTRLHERILEVNEMAPILPRWKYRNSSGTDNGGRAECDGNKEGSKNAKDNESEPSHDESENKQIDENKEKDDADYAQSYNNEDEIVVCEGEDISEHIKNLNLDLPPPKKNLSGSSLSDESSRKDGLKLSEEHDAEQSVSSEFSTTRQDDEDNYEDFKKDHSFYSENSNFGYYDQSYQNPHSQDTSYIYSSQPICDSYLDPDAPRPNYIPFFFSLTQCLISLAARNKTVRTFLDACEKWVAFEKQYNIEFCEYQKNTALNSYMSIHKKKYSRHFSIEDGQDREDLNSRGMDYSYDIEEYMHDSGSDDELKLCSGLDNMYFQEDIGISEDAKYNKESKKQSEDDQGE
ncbi:serine/threonine-protein phosphatase 6 regulatory subunit 3-like [Schistocerca gregaria]|uniref:serine/threonine-protein phosphatase 6 regulatory subunit 3-like n=1 Tax=Schistocerca gregaria TaxID=7010 RepID=UPI00211DA8C9|nr:serine/threonine-protein phosphatase 6 regulatory subunit 3-like [Schistocerca gregaria]XP_049849907.1 serine/threonine-protein phosphatase 6 regulatory subunit 3-like [Schistocerca gregaria]